MLKDLEVLSFNVNFKSEKFKLNGKLKHFDKAPFDINKSVEDINFSLYKFFNSRIIPPQREDYEQILKATGCKSSLELVFKGHGASLSNHYWFRKPEEKLSYEDINFFTNKWDDSFAKAVIAKDYDALKNCDLNVPDLLTSGWGIKGWIYDNGPKLYKLGIHEGNEEAIAEVLASRLAARLFRENEYLKYELKMFNGAYVSICSPIININEELIPLSDVLDGEIYSLYRDRTSNKESGKKFFEKIEEYKELNLKDFFVKLSCLRDLCFASDLHFGNIGIIKNLNDGSLKIAPIYDLGSSFGSSRTAQSFVRNFTSATILLIYFIFNDLDPDWDYSWYNKDNLIGYEDEMVEYLSKCEIYTPQIISATLDIYHHQKAVLDEFSNKVSNR